MNAYKFSTSNNSSSALCTRETPSTLTVFRDKICSVGIHLFLIGIQKTGLVWALKSYFDLIINKVFVSPSLWMAKPMWGLQEV